MLDISLFVLPYTSNEITSCSLLVRGDKSVGLGVDVGVVVFVDMGAGVVLALALALGVILDGSVSADEGVCVDVDKDVVNVVLDVGVVLDVCVDEGVFVGVDNLCIFFLLYFIISFIIYTYILFLYKKWPILHITDEVLEK